jgi:hypothetical protein
VDRIRVTRRAAALSLLLGVSVLLWKRRSGAPAPRSIPSFAFKGAAVSAGCVIAILSAEAGLRALGNRAPAAILAERHDLGEVRRDTRWEYTARYGRRFRPNVDEISEWRYGDIVRMGFIPAGVTDGAMHRFAFRTDAEGFRNARTRDRIDVAALGDSFTDAMTLDAAQAWPSLLEQDTGFAVQNYGTAGFSPQQELRVLTDFALRHHPRFVVLAYFAGNDLFDAEAFETYDESQGRLRRPDPGWPIKDIVSLADESYLVSAVRAARRWTSSRDRVEASTSEPPAHYAPVPADRAAFDRGMFSVPVGERLVRFALMPPYLNTLTMSAAELEHRRGWLLTRATIRQMQREARAAGADFAVLFLPFKSQIYLPIAATALPADDLARALAWYLPDRAVDVSAMTRNLRAQNGMMRRLCAEAGIRMVDATGALAARLAQGDNVYFPDESHLNEIGQRVVADVVRQELWP